VVAAVVGVPVIMPVAGFRDRLAGSAGETDHMYGSAPPEPLREAEYGWLMVPSGREVVVMARLPGVGPLSPPQAVNPRIEIQKRTAAKKI
jgi:hypothetical protein